ncbi:MAG: SDR family oxidoreductase [Azospirillaceae bacterium]
MTGTILITGSSSGIGRATAEFFRDKGWNVVATMLDPDEGRDLAAADNVLVTQLDVTDNRSIVVSVAEAMHRFGEIDAVFNNAGYGSFGPLEFFTMTQIRRAFETNVLGQYAVIKAVLPHFRQRRSGTIINMSSVAGRTCFPTASVYYATKYAIEGMSESLRFELEPLGIGVKIIEPGAVNSSFIESMECVNDMTVSDYQKIVTTIFKNLDNYHIAGEPWEVAEAVWAAATDGTDRLRYPVAGEAEHHLAVRASLSDNEYMAYVKRGMGLADEPDLAPVKLAG